MPYNRDAVEYEVQAIRGAAALKEMLGEIGAHEADDKTVAKLLVDNELPLLALLTFSFDALRDKI